jgi:hypothetical protein
MPDLVVKFQMLEDSQSSLKSIMTEFDKTETRVDGLDDIWSDGDVQSAMHSFATDWQDHKQKLLQKMDDAYKHSAKCLQSWQKSDSSLAASVTTHSDQSGGSGQSGSGAS